MRVPASELNEKSMSYVPINTHKGLFRYTRLPFEVTSAPAIFQQVMEEVLHGIPNVFCYLDDILITGKNEVEHHLQNLTAVFERLRNCGLRLKKRQCQFMENEWIMWDVGYQISELLRSISSKFDRSMSFTE